MLNKRTWAFSLLLFGCCFFAGENGFAQAADKLPSFSMMLSSGRYYQATDIPKGKPVLLIYFAPDCDHCHTLMNEFFKRPNDFKTAEVVMVTFKPASDLPAFEQAYKTFLYPNIKVGTEGNTYYLQRLYNLQKTPFVALYNKEGKMISSYRKDPSLEKLSKQLKQL